MSEDIANSMLYKNYILNVDMIECIRRGNVDILFASSEGVLIQDKYSLIYMLSAENLEIAERMIKLIPFEAEMVVVHQDFCCKLIENRINSNFNIACYYSVWTKKLLIEIPRGEIEVRKLTKENLDIVVSSYSSIDLVGKEYIEERIESENMLGAFINEKLCGFIGNHEEGSIGLLEVLEEYRGMGIATILQAEATNKALKEGRIPYGEVREENEKSLGLQKKLGFEICNDKIYWLMK
ncbi:MULTISPECIES: GNAT family N-acetyltransferase [Clostridium]|uniref:GNAT family N-acetyltransferase n=1 Tax=Clostridium cibarium TaxID=2762247 RepID=A0ABR8PXQ8_9CLOT|nr:MULTISPECIES: GNAT family N-acetyltransferase [Clostridium]MBD7912957.1 GNAT family N-acetyltransferase [Clostridium cibarium]